MKQIEASGSCGLCGRYSKARGADEMDAHILLHHEHGHEYKHVFHGEPTFREVDSKATKPSAPRTTRRR